jgi:hypothetical protein
MRAVGCERVVVRWMRLQDRGRRCAGAVALRIARVLGDRRARDETASQSLASANEAYKQLVTAKPRSSSW